MPAGSDDELSGMRWSSLSLDASIRANTYNEQERAAARQMANKAYGRRGLTAAETNAARDRFARLMRVKFGDRGWSMNWTVWRSEYEGRYYPPGSFDPAVSVEQDISRAEQRRVVVETERNERRSMQREMEAQRQEQRESRLGEQRAVEAREQDSTTRRIRRIRRLNRLSWTDNEDE